MSFKRVLFGVTGGGMLGWLAHVGVSKFDGKPESPNDDPFADIMSSHYKTTKWNSNWDKRAPSSLINPKKLSKNGNNSNNNNSEELKKVTPTASRHLLLIRHGQYNLDGNTDADRLLTPLGREQALGTAKRLVDLGHPYTVLIHSSMTRAKETSEIIHTQLPDLPTVQCDLLREGSPFLPEPEPANWRAETKYHTDGARIEAAFRKYFHRADPKQTADSYEIIVCHANVIRYFACRALQLPPEAWLRLSLFNASITMFTIRPSGNVSLRTLGDAGHLPAKMCTTT